MGEGAPKRAATIKDVAELANVHHSTASRALRGSPEIHAETILRVKAAARELGYQPNLAARALRDPSSTPIAAILVDPITTGRLSRYSAFWISLMAGLTRGLTESGIGLVQMTTDVAYVLDDLPIRALMVLSLLDAPTGMPPSMSGTPFLTTRDHTLASSAVATVGHDHAQMADEACDYLYEKGSRQIAYLPLSIHDQISVAASVGYQRWCARTGQTPIVIDPSLDPVAQSDAVRAAVSDGVDGIYGTTGEVRSVLDGISGANKRCPDEVQFMCCGEGMTERLITPQLTSMSLNGEAAGQDIARSLAKVIAGDEVDDVVFRHDLTVRESTRA